MTYKEAIQILKNYPSKDNAAVNLAIKALEAADTPRFIIRAKNAKSAQEFSDKFREAWEANQSGVLIPADVEVIPLTPPGCFTREELEAWLWKIALNNTDNNAGEICKEIIDRLDGFERFCKDRREGRV